MADRISEERRSYNMRRIRSSGTGIELIARRLVWGVLGQRYRLHDRSLPGRPDLVFKGRKKAIFVHGCFWHQHPSETCLDARLPQTRLAYWGAKLNKNVERDTQVYAQLRGMGWRTLVLWGCELEKDQTVALSKLERFLLTDR